jgi:Fur family ferric uptake transcriptional regulator
MHQFVQASNELLRKRGYRLTPQRYLILSVLQEAQEHLTIEQITERVQERSPFVSVSTIYRTLELLKRLELIREDRLPGEPPYYEAVEGSDHHHLVCLRCRMTVHLEPELLGKLHERLQQEYQYHGLTLNLVATGYCSYCWREVERERLERIAQAPETQDEQGESQQIDEQQFIEPVDAEEEL